MKRALFFGALALATFAPAIFTGQVPMFRDFGTAFLPFKLYAARAIASGRLPLWSPEMAFGTPFLANYLSGVLYPPSAIIDLWPGPPGIGLYLALHFWIAGFGMSHFLRRRGLSEAASTFGGVVFMLGGVMVSIAPWGHLAVACWIPWTLLAIEDLVHAPSPHRFAWLVTLLLLELLAGGPESFVMGAVLGAGAAWMASRKVEGSVGAVALTGACAILAVGLASVQLLPTLEYVLETERGRGLAPSMALSQSFDPRTLLTLVLPRRLDGGMARGVIESELPLLWSIYVGLLPFVLLLVGVGTRRCFRWTLVLGAALILALGSRSPFYRALITSFPGVLGAVRYPQKLLVLAHVAAAVLAGYGFARAEAAASGLAVRRRRFLAAASLAFVVVDLWDVHRPALLFMDWAPLERSVPSDLAAAGRGARVYGYEPRPPGLTSWLPTWSLADSLRERQRLVWAGLGGNVPLAYGIGFTNGHDGLVFARPEIAALERTLRAEPVERALHLLRSLAVTHLVGEHPLDAGGVQVARAGSGSAAWIYRIVDPPPRIYLARRFSTEPSLPAAYRTMADARFTPGEDAVLAAPLAGRVSGALAGGGVSVVEETAETTVFDVSLEGDGLVVVSDSFFPGWQAAVDGRPTEILRVNGLARAIAVEAGRHRVALVYAPVAFRVGCWLSAASLLALALVMRVVRSAGRHPLSSPTRR